MAQSDMVEEWLRRTESPQHIDEHNAAEARRQLVVIHNDLIQKNLYKLHRNAGKSLTLVEKKIVAFLISHIKPGDTSLEPMIFDMKAFSQACGLDTRSGGIVETIKRAVKRLADRSVWLSLDPDSETIVRWITKATIHASGRYITIQLDPLLEPYLIGLKKNYASYEFGDVSRMHSQYGIELYEKLKSSCYKGPVIEYELMEFRELLDCATAGYDRISNLKAKVIEPAINDINRYTPLKVAYELVKDGRRITGIKFFVQNLKQSLDEEDRELYRQRFLNVEHEATGEPPLFGTVPPLFAEDVVEVPIE